VIVLYKVEVNSGQLPPALFIETFKKETTLIAENSRLNDQDIGNGCGDNLHAKLRVYQED
jgi:hypothetical protein